VVNSRLIGIVVGLCAALAFTGAASAATFTVADPTDAALQSPSSTSCVSTDAGKCTLRAAVQAADNAGGPSTIKLGAGNYKLAIDATGTTPGDDTNDPAHGDLNVLAGVSLTVAGAGSATTTIDANSLDRAFFVGAGAVLSLSGLTIEHGNPSIESLSTGSGGAIEDGGALSLTSDVVLRHNNSLDDSSGGAIEVAGTSTSLSVTGASFIDDAAYGDGGAIQIDGSATTPVSIASSTFDGDQAGEGNGGAVFDYTSGRLTISGSHFTDNSAGGTESQGGAVADFGASADSITGSTFTSNNAFDGGAMYLASTAGAAATTLSEDELDNNRGDAGGAIWWNTGSLTITSSSVIGNTAGDTGGGLYLENLAGALLTVTNTTISDNTAVFGGGVEFGSSPKISFTNDTIAFNGARGGGGVSNAESTTAGGSGIVNTIVADNAGGDCSQTFKAVDDDGDNLDSDTSCFGGLGVSPPDKTGVNPLLSPAAANGGPVMTDALAAGSPAIGGAKASACPPTDARGVIRPQGSGCDIGAFEASTPTVAITAPGNGASYGLSAVVKAAYACAEAGAPSLIASCKGPVPAGARIDTTHPGSHSFTVTVTDLQGQQVSETVHYTVRPAPNTRVTGHKVSGHSATMRFTGSGGTGKLKFRCRLDKGRFRACRSPKRYTKLKPGRHTVSVEAVDSAGAVDPTPAKLGFSIR
jgi:hypothetical protein